MPTLCMEGLISVDICDLARLENRAGFSRSSVLETVSYKRISTSIKRKGQKSKTGRRRGNKDYESAALTIELRARVN